MKRQILVKVVYGTSVSSLCGKIIQLAGVTDVQVISSSGVYSLKAVVEVGTKDEVAVVIKAITALTNDSGDLVVKDTLDLPLI